jgi:hypothetical protein
VKVVDYEILVQDLVPPIGGVLKHYAVIQFLVVETEEGNKRIDPGLGEAHGKTPEEARAKMQAKFDGWREANV